jgi:hypothetical protein
MECVQAKLLVTTSERACEALQLFNESMYPRPACRIPAFRKSCSFEQPPGKETCDGVGEMERQRRSLGLGLAQSALNDDLHTNTKNHLLLPATAKTSMTYSSTALLTLILKGERCFGQHLRPIIALGLNGVIRSRKSGARIKTFTKSLPRCHFSTSQSHAQRIIDAKFYFQLFSKECNESCSHSHRASFDSPV